MNFPGAEQRHCRVKKIHVSMRNAEAEAARLHKLHQAVFTAYQCLFCNGFHVGRERSKAAAIRRSEKKVACA